MAQALCLRLGEEGAYGVLAAVPEGRVAHVVCQAGGTHDVAEALKARVQPMGLVGLQPDIPVQEPLAHVVAQRASHTCHFKTVGEPVVYKDAPWQREHLCLVLHPAEGGRKDEPVVVALKLTPALHVGLGSTFLAEPLRRNQIYPVQNNVFFLRIAATGPRPLAL